MQPPDPEKTVGDLREAVALYLRSIRCAKLTAPLRRAGMSEEAFELTAATTVYLVALAEGYLRQFIDDACRLAGASASEVALRFINEHRPNPQGGVGEYLEFIKSSLGVDLARQGYYEKFLAFRIVRNAAAHSAGFVEPSKRVNVSGSLGKIKVQISPRDSRLLIAPAHVKDCREVCISLVRDLGTRGWTSIVAAS